VALLGRPLLGRRDLAPALALALFAVGPASGTPSLGERPGDPPGRPAAIRVSPPRSARLGAYSSVQVNVLPGGANVFGDAANEPSIAVDPRNPNRMAIGWRQFDTITSNFRQAGWAWSRDGGRTWRTGGVLESGVFRSDPVLTADADGRMFYSSLAAGFEVDVFVSSNGGVSWIGPFDAWGGDKQWIAAHRTAGRGLGSLYQSWSTEGSCCGANLFTRSVDHGFTFSQPVGIFGSPIWGTIDVGPDGAVYVAGVDRRYMNRMVLAKSMSAGDPSQLPFFESGSWANLGGSVRAIAGTSTPNPDGLLGQVWIAVDPSAGRTAGWVYLLCSVDPPGPDPMDVQFARSVDGGATWSAPVRVNTDSTLGWQWMGTMSVAPTGRIDVVWNDTRAYAGPDTSALYYASSSDGGETWTPELQMSPAWDSHVGWPSQAKIGDYYHMVSDRTGADLAWAATFNGEQDVWYLRIGDRDCDQDGVGDATEIVQGTATDTDGDGILDECELPAEPVLAGAGFELHPNVPNPFNPTTRIVFDAPHGGAAVQVEILDVAGRLVRRFERTTSPGRNEVLWDGRDAVGRPSASGVYLYRLLAPTFSATGRMVLLR
jgi:hypothetical protein